MLIKRAESFLHNRRLSQKADARVRQTRVRKHKGASEKAERRESDSNLKNHSVSSTRACGAACSRPTMSQMRVRRRGPKCTATSPKSASGTASADEVPNAPQQAQKAHRGLHEPTRPEMHRNKPKKRIGDGVSRRGPKCAATRSKVARSTKGAKVKE